jgi:amidase
MQTTEYEQHDGIDLATLLYSRQVSASELMQCAISLSQECDEHLNALCYTNYDEAANRAAKAELKGHFGALPFLLKDSGLPSAQLPSGMGSRLFAGSRAPGDSTLNTRFMEDGFIAYGRTTVPEFSMAPTTEAVQNGGPTRNPWDPTRSCGGSSGGAAVAVATRMVPIAHGSDGGGSIRIPASCCGIYGLKPSRGLVPVGPFRGEAWGGLAAEGVLTRTVRDTAAALDGVVGMELGAPYAAPAIPGSYLEMLDRPFRRPLKIAVWKTAFEDIPVAPECTAAVEAAAVLLRKMEHEVIEAPLPPIQFSKFLNAHVEVMAASVTMTVNGKVRNDPKSGWEQKLEPAILDAYRLGSTLTAEAYALAINRFHSIARQMEVYMADYDFILTPTLTQLPVKLGTYSMNDDFRSFRSKVGRYTTFLGIINASGQPAASLPLHWSRDGLPIGVQLIARFGQEADLLRLSARLEEAAPWKHRRPSFQR